MKIEIRRVAFGLILAIGGIIVVISSIEVVGVEAIRLPSSSKLKPGKSVSLIAIDGVEIREETTIVTIGAKNYMVLGNVQRGDWITRDRLGGKYYLRTGAFPHTMHLLVGAFGLMLLGWAFAMYIRAALCSRAGQLKRCQSELIDIGSSNKQ